MKKESNTSRRFENVIKTRSAPFTDYDVLFISALNKQRINKILDLVERVDFNRKRKIATSKLNGVMLEAVKLNQPPSVKGRHITIKYVTQLPSYTPAFAFFCNLPQYIKAPYKRYLENRLRENFDFRGVPVKIFFRKK